MTDNQIPLKTGDADAEVHWSAGNGSLTLSAGELTVSWCRLLPARAGQRPATRAGRLVEVLGQFRARGQKREAGRMPGRRRVHFSPAASVDGPHPDRWSG